jgi:cytochrome c-type biogenesis protein CcmH/NrfF
MCGDCQRLPLSTCSCGWAENARAAIRGQLASGVVPAGIQDAYREEHGAVAIAIPADAGLDRALWAVPVTLIALAAGGLFWLGRRWVIPADGPGDAAGATAAGDGYDEVLDRELGELDD